MVIDPSWENVFQSREWGRRPNHKVITTIFDNFYFHDRSQTKILDLGCGFGSNTWYCALEEFNTYAIDGSPKAIEETHKLLEKLDTTAKLTLGDITKLPYYDSFFDMVIDVCAISCCELGGATKAYSEAARVLKTGGVLYTQLFAEGTDPKCFPPGTYNRITTWEEIRAMVNPHFSIISYDKSARHSPVYGDAVEIVEHQIGLRKK